MNRVLFQVMIAVLTVGIFCGCGREDVGAGGKTTAEDAASAPRIAVIPKGTTHVFWKSVEAGALQAGEELGVDIRWKGPLKENDRAQQIEVVQQFISEGVDAIVLAPLDSEALLGVCRAAMEKDIPVIIFDSALNGEVGQDYVSFVATDNRAGGRLGGEKLSELMGGAGDAVVLRYQVGSASTEKREAGCLEALGHVAGITVVSDNQYGGATVGETIQVTENMLDTLKAAQGIFTPNESSTVGMLTTLQRHGIAGAVTFVGFDASDTLIDALKAGEIDALVVQNPKRMGYLGVKTAVDVLQGKAPAAYIDTGVGLVTAGNLETAEVQAMLR